MDTPNGLLRGVAIGLATAVGIATLARPAAGAASPPGPFGNPFGMQLRTPPVQAGAVHAPVIVAPSPNNESCALARRDGTLEVYSIALPEHEAVSVIRSRDGGLAWSEPARAFALPGRAYYAVRVLEAADGSLQAVFHLQGAGEGGYRGRLYQVYHVRKPAGAAHWSAPQLVVPGYVGSIRGFTQLAGSRRLVLAVGRAVPERQVAPRVGPDSGWNDVFVYYSDDHGATWRESVDRLSLVLPDQNVTRYGAIEPVMLGLRDGRAWMLVRDRGGRLWQSFSADGARWAPLVRSPFISSDSPAELLRLRNGKIVLFTNACQFWSDPRSYAMGGREVLQAAISADEGRTWRGFREVLHETNRATRGDRGSGYPSAAESREGKVVVTGGQGEGKRAIVMFDPHWLEETTVNDDLARGPVGWTQYGADGLRVDVTADGSPAVAIPLKASGPGGALWNFPMADAGEISFALQVPAGAGEVRLCLNDHFNRIDDRGAADHAVFNVPLGGLDLAPARSHRLRLRWADAVRGGEVGLELDDQPGRRIVAQRAAQFGVNYLRIEFSARSGEGALTIAQLMARVR